MRINFSILFFALYFTNIISANEKNYYLILKNNKVNVRYGPGFDYPIKFVYKKKCKSTMLDLKKLYNIKFKR